MFRKMSFGARCLLLAKIPILFVTLVLTCWIYCFQVRLLSIRIPKCLAKFDSFISAHHIYLVEPFLGNFFCLGVIITIFFIRIKTYLVC